MKESTVKLSGPSKDRFLERFFAEETVLGADVRQRLVVRSKAAFTSLRVRKALLAPQRSPHKSGTQIFSRPVGVAPTERDPVAPAGVVPPPVISPGKEPAHVDAAVVFDAYAIGLVPVFQREGGEGLLVRLAEVTSLDHLRQMAKAQQIVLSQELRTGAVAVDVVRTAIVEAVAKRIADRRAAAG